MEHVRAVTSGKFVWLVSLVAMASIAAAQGVDLSAKILRVKGSARYSTGNDVWQPIRVGTYLQPGSIIQTSADNSFVDVVVGVTPSEAPPSAAVFKPFAPSSYSGAISYKPTASENVFRIWENTTLGIDKLTMQDSGTGQITETMLDLKQGRITGVAKKISPASKFEIKLPKGVASIRGTTFELLAEGVVKCFTGSVMMAWVREPGANVVTQLVENHQKYDARTGEITPLPEDEGIAFDRLASELLVFEATSAPAGISSDLTFTALSPVEGTP